MGTIAQSNGFRYNSAAVVGLARRTHRGAVCKLLNQRTLVQRAIALVFLCCVSALSFSQQQATKASARSSTTRKAYVGPSVAKGTKAHSGGSQLSYYMRSTGLGYVELLEKLAANRNDDLDDFYDETLRSMDDHIEISIQEDSADHDLWEMLKTLGLLAQARRSVAVSARGGNLRDRSLTGDTARIKAEAPFWAGCYVHVKSVIRTGIYTDDGPCEFKSIQSAAESAEKAAIAEYDKQRREALNPYFDPTAAPMGGPLIK